MLKKLVCIFVFFFVDLSRKRIVKGRLVRVLKACFEVLYSLVERLKNRLEN